MADIETIMLRKKVQKIQKILASERTDNLTKLNLIKELTLIAGLCVLNPDSCRIFLNYAWTQVQKLPENLKKDALALINGIRHYALD